MPPPENSTSALFPSDATARAYSQQFCYPTKFSRGKVRQIREDGRQIRCRHSKPVCQGSGVLVQCRRWDPSALACSIIRAAKRQRGERPEEISAVDSSSHNQVMAAPRVIASGSAIGLERAAEIRQCEAGNLRCCANFHGRLI